jgi:hypothetical protein
MSLKVIREIIMIRCTSCNGKKKVLCLGNILKECPYCGGVGFTNDTCEAEMDGRVNYPPNETMDLPKPRKKPGRKPKEVVLHV